MIKAHIEHFSFDYVAFGEAIEGSGIDDKTLGDYLGVSSDTIKRWRTAKYKEGESFAHPSMSNFLKLCNALDLNCHSFFKLD